MGKIDLTQIAVAVIGAVAVIWAACAQHANSVSKNSRPVGLPSDGHRTWWSVLFILAILVGGLNIGIFGYRRISSRPSVSIMSPEETQFRTSVRVNWKNLPATTQIWVVVYSRIDDLYFPQARVPVNAADGIGSASVEIGAPNDVGRVFETLAVAVGPEADRAFSQYASDPSRAGLQLLPRDVVALDRREVRRR